MQVLPECTAEKVTGQEQGFQTSFFAKSLRQVCSMLSDLLEMSFQVDRRCLIGHKNNTERHLHEQQIQACLGMVHAQSQKKRKKFAITT